MAGCVDCAAFETKLEVLMQSKKRKNNIDKHTKQKLSRNKWSLTCEGKVTASDNKLVVPKRDISRLLCEAHTATAHRGRDKTERYLRNY